ncbi:Dystonin, partial [Acipenser ruthenus]
QVKLVNIRNDDITDGNPKLTLGLIWTIILHFQISDIHVPGVPGDMTAKEKLLLWSQQTTESYVGVRCENFTTCWRDGRLFNAIIHKYRPDLIDMNMVATQSSRSNLEQAFCVAEQLGVTRLLDPEDVDVQSPDEKSVITYVSILYDVFPKIPEGEEGITAHDVDIKWVEYQNMVNYLSQWIRHHLTIMSDRTFPNNPVELKDVDIKWVEYQNMVNYLSQWIRHHLTIMSDRTFPNNPVELKSWIEFGRIKLPQEYHPNDVEREWGKLIIAMLEREKSLRPEVDRLEMLQQIASRVQRDCVAGEDKLVLARNALQSDAKRLESGIQFQNEAEIAGYLLECESLLRQQVVDIQILLDGKYYLADQLVQRSVPGFNTYPDIRTAAMSLPWTHLQFYIKSDSLSDPFPHPSHDPGAAASNGSSHYPFFNDFFFCHKQIQMTSPHKYNYSERLSKLENQYGKLLNSSRNRQKYLESLHEFVSRATREIIWLNEKEEEEVAYDWSDRNSNMAKKRDYHADLMRELDEKERAIKSVQDMAERLLLENHPAKLTIEAYRAAMQTQWSWILQLCGCVEQHLKENAVYFEFFNDAKESMDYLNNLQDTIQRKYGCDRTSNLHKLEDLIKESMDEKEQLLQYRSTVASLVGRAKGIAQLKPRNPDGTIRCSIPVKAICDYRQIEITIFKEDECVLASNSYRAKWKVISPNGNEAMVPSVCFTIPPPNKEAIETVSRIEQLYQNVLTLWHHSHINMKSVVSWHYLMNDIEAIQNSNVASIKTMLPGEHQQVLSNLQSHFEDFLEDSQESEVFTVSDRGQLEREVVICKQYYEDLLKSAEREEHEESVYNLFISEVRNFRMRLENYEERLIRQIRAPLERDDLQESVLRIAEQEKSKKELDRLKEDLETMQEKCETFISQAASTPSVPTLSTELNVVVQNMNQVYSMLKTVSRVVKNSQGAEALVRLYEAKLCEEDAVNAETKAIETVVSTLKLWCTEIDEKREVFHDLEDELQKARAISDRMFKMHNERDFDLDWHKEKADQLAERWQNVHSQIENRLRDLECTCKSLKYYKDTYHALDEWIKEMEDTQLKMQENQPEDSKALAELLNQQKVLVSEIEMKQSKIDECQKYSEQYSAVVKDYELQLMTYRAMVDSQQKSPVKRRRMQSSSDVIIQEFMDLRTRYTALVTLMTQYVKFASETLKRTEEEEYSSDEGELYPPMETEYASNEPVNIGRSVKNAVPTALPIETAGTNKRDLPILTNTHEDGSFPATEKKENERDSSPFEAVMQDTSSIPECSNYIFPMDTIKGTIDVADSAVSPESTVVPKKKSVEEEKKEHGEKVSKLLNWASNMKKTNIKEEKLLQDEKNVTKDTSYKPQVSMEEVATKKEQIAEALRTTQLMLVKHSDKMTEEERQDTKEQLKSLQQAYNDLSRQSVNQLPQPQSLPAEQDYQTIEGLIDLETGAVFSVCRSMQKGLIDYTTGINLLEAQLITSGLILPELSVCLDLDDAFKHGLVDKHTYNHLQEMNGAKRCILSAKYASEPLPLIAAWRDGIISEQLAIRMIEIQLATGGLRVTYTGDILNLEKAFQSGLIPPPLFLKILEREDTCKDLIDPNTAEKVSLIQLVQRSLVHEETGLRLLPVKKGEDGKIALKSGREVSILRAVHEGLIDRETMFRLLGAQLFAGGIMDPTTNSKLNVKEAVQEGLIDQDTACKILSYQAQNGGIVNPCTGDRLTMDEAVQCNLITSSSALLVLEKQKAFMGLIWPCSGEIFTVSTSIQHEVITNELAYKLLSNRQKIAALYIPESSEVVSIEDATKSEIIDSNTAGVLNSIVIPDVIPDIDDLDEKIATWVSSCDLQLVSSHESQQNQEISELKNTNLPSSSEAKQLFISYLMINSYMDPKLGQRLLVYDRELAKITTLFTENAEKSHNTMPCLKQSSVSLDKHDCNEAVENRVSEQSVGRHENRTDKEPNTMPNQHFPRQVQEQFISRLHDCFSEETESYKHSDNKTQVDNAEVYNTMNCSEDGVEKQTHISADRYVAVLPSITKDQSQIQFQTPNHHLITNANIEGQEHLCNQKHMIETGLDGPHTYKEIAMGSDTKETVLDGDFDMLPHMRECSLYKDVKCNSFASVSSDINDKVSKIPNDCESQKADLEFSGKTGIFTKGLGNDEEENLLLLKDVEKGKLEQQNAANILKVQLEECGILDYATGERYDLDTALEKGLVGKDTILDVLALQFQDGGINDEQTGETLPLKEDVAKGLIPSHVGLQIEEKLGLLDRFYESKTGKTITINDAIQQGLVDNDVIEKALLSEKVIYATIDPESNDLHSVPEGAVFSLLNDSTAQRLLEGQVLSGGIVDLEQGKQVSVTLASKLGLINEQLGEGLLKTEEAITGKEVDDSIKLKQMGLQMELSGMQDPEVQQPLPLTEAIEKARVDKDTAPSILCKQLEDGGIVQHASGLCLSVGNALKHGLIDQNMVYELSKLENNICKNTTPETFENCSHEVSQEPAEFADGDKFSEHAVPYSDLINGSSIDMQSGKRYLDLKTCKEAEYTGQNVQLKKSGVDFESNIIQIGNQEHNESDRSSPSHDNKPSEPNTFKNTSSETEDTSSLCSSLNHTDYLKERVDSIKIETEMFMSHTSDSGSLIRKEKCKEENFMDAPAHSIHCYLNVAESVNTGFCQAEMDSLAERDRESTSDVSNDLVNASPSTQIKYEVQDNRDNLEVNTSMTEACTDPQVENGTEVKAFIVRNQYLQDDFKIRSDMSNHIQGGAMDQLLDSSEKTILRDSNDSVNSRVVTGDICTERKSMDANVDLSTQFTDSVGKLTVQSDISSITDSSASESVQTSDVCSKLRSSLQELVKITVEDTNAKVLQKAESQVAEDIIKMIISIQECPTEENAVSHDEEKGPQLSDIHDKSPDVFTDLLKQEFLHSKADEQLGAKKDLALKEKMHETNPAAAAELFQSQLQQVQLAASLNDDPAMFKELAGKLSDILGGNLECERNQTPGSARGDRSKQVAAAVNETLNSDEPEFCNLTETIKALSKQEKVEQVSADLCEDTQSPQNKTETKGEPKSNGATQHHLKCIGKLQDHSEVLELLKNKLDSLEPLGNNLDTLTIQLEESELLESQLSSLAGTLTKDLKTADQLLESANEYVPMQIRCDLEMVSKNVQLAFSDACKMSTERRHLSKLAYSNQELLERVQKLSVCIEESAGSITNLDIMNTDDMETVELRIQQNKDLDKALSITKNQLDATAFDVQYFISEHAQDLSPTQSKLLLKSLNAAQKSFKELMEVVLTQQDTLMLHLEIRQDLSNQKNVAEKQKEYTEKLQELCHHLTQTENRLIGHQQTTISGDSLGDLQQFQTEHQALQRDVQAGDSALTEVVRCTKKFLEENRGKLQPEQIAMIENKLEEANSKSKLINQRAEESRKDLDKAMTTAIKQETEKVAAVKQLEESKNKIEGLLGWLSNVGKEKDMEGNVEQQVAKQNGNLPLESTDTLMIVEEDEANGNLQQVQTGTVVDGKGKATEELDLNKEYDKVKAHHQEILSQQPDFIIATQSAQALLEKQGHMLSPEEKEKLQRNIQELKDCYETTLTKTEHKMKQIHSVQEELQKFKTDCSEFENWLQQSEGEITDLKTGAPDLSVLNGKLQRQRSFSEDVISHKGDLRFITISGQRVLDAAKSCSKADTSKDSELDIDTSGVCTVVQDKLDSAANRYKTLHSQCNQLGNNLKDVVEKYKQYEDASTGLGSWLEQSEEVARKQLAEPVAADPKNLQKQLEETKALQGQMSGRQGAVEKLRKTADALTATEGDLLTNQDTIQETVDDIVERYDNLSKAVSDRNEKLQITLTRSLSVQDGLDEMLTWMEGVEKSLGEKDQVPLNSTAIQDILSKKAVLEQDFSIRQSSITAMKEKVKKFIETADPSTASSLQAKMDTLSKCFTDSCKKHKEKVTKLEELKDKVELFEKTAQKVQQFVAKRSQALSETDGPGKNVNELSQLIQDTNAELSDYAKDVELLRNLSKELAEASPEGSNVRILEKVDNLSKKFKEFEDTFKEKEEEVSSCQGQLAEFKCAVESFRKWLDESTEKIPVVKPACSVEDHQKHLLKAKALLEEWLSKASMLQEINNKGSALCNLISVLTSPVKTKTTVKSELTVVQQNMSYVNHGYEILGVHLKENVGELDGMLVKLREVQDEANSLMQWFDDINKTTSSWDAVPTEAESMKTQMEQQKRKVFNEYSKVIRLFLIKVSCSLLQTFEAELKQKQGKLKQLKEKLLDLLEKHPDSPEAAKWKQMLNQIDSTWKDINSSVDERKQKLEESSKNLTQFQTAEAQLKQWLAEKELMMSVLGPLSIDPNMLNAQKQQVQILQNEFDTRKSQYHQLKESAQGILERPGDLPPSCKVLKDQLAAVAEKWENLTGRLSDRSEQIDQAIVKTNEFQNLLKKISENVDVLNSKLNSQSSLSTQPDAVKQQLETANEICTKLGEEKKNVEEAEVLCKELSALVCEEYLKTDLSRQLESVKKPFKDLEERTGNRIQQLNSAFASSQQFHQMSKDFHGWLDGKRQEHSMSPLISAELETLQQTIKEHAEFQKSLNEQNAAYEIIIKDGETLLQKTQGAEKSALQSQLALLKANWDELKKQSSERQDKLQGCLQRAQKYKQHVEKLRPWIEECENKVAKVKICIDPAEVERSISEVKTLQKDLDKHRGMVELLNTAADSLFEVSQADEDLIRDEKASFNQKVDNMTEQLQNKKDSLEEIAQRLKEFNESHKEAKEQLYGAKQQLEAHESLGAQAYSNKHLTNMKAQQKTLETLKTQVDYLKNLAQGLVVDAPDAAGVSDLLLQTDSLNQEYNSVNQQVEEKCSFLETKLQGIGQFQNNIREMFSQFADFDDELDSLQPVARDLDTLQSQKDDMKSFVNKLQELMVNTVNANKNCKKMLETEGSPDLLGLKRDLEALNKQCSKLMDRAKGREELVETTLIRVDELYKKIEELSEKLQVAKEHEESQGPVGMETEIINQQLDVFKMGKPLSRPDCLRRNPTCVGKGEEEDFNIEDCYVPQRSIYDTVRLNEQIDSGSKGSLTSRHFTDRTLPYSHRTLDSSTLCSNAVLASSSVFELRSRETNKLDEKMIFDALKLNNDIIRASGTVLPKTKSHTEKKENRRSWRMFVPANFAEFANRSEGSFVDGTAVTDLSRRGKHKRTSNSLTSEEDSGLCSPTVERELRHNTRERGDTGGRSLSSTEGIHVSEEHKTVFTAMSVNKDHLFTPELVPTGLYYSEMTETEISEEFHTYAKDPFGIDLEGDHHDGLESFCRIPAKLQNGINHYDIKKQFYPNYNELPTAELLQEPLSPEIESYWPTVVEMQLDSEENQAFDNGVHCKLENSATTADVKGLPFCIEDEHFTHNGVYPLNGPVMDEGSGSRVETKATCPETDKSSPFTYKVFQKEEIEPLQAKLQDVNWLGQGLIQSAAKNANTQALEGDLEDVNTRWNTLNKKVAERDTQLHEALLHCGRFQDALESLLSWLNDTEDLVANQKPPSAEFKVVKAQIQEQKLLQRLLDDRKPTVDIIKREGEKLSGAAEPADKEKMLKELGSLDHRWDALLSKAETRHRQLESILVVAQQFHETLEPLAEWLSATEKRLANSEPIGTQTKKLEQQISQHKALEDDIMGHSKNLHQAISLGQTLKTMSSMDDKELVQGKLDSTQTHAIEVQERCSRKAVMLQQALSNAQLFGEDEVALMNWLNEVHDKLSNVAVQDYNTDVLHKQHYEQLALHEDIVLRKQNVHLAIQNGLKLLKQTTGDEVVIIQEKLDGIKARYAEVNSMSTDVSKSLNQALTLATKLQQNHEELCSWLDNIEAEVAAYEVQVPAGEQLTQVQERQKELLKDAKEHKRLVDTLNEVSSALLELVPWRAREGLDKLVCEDNERYRLVSDSIMQHVEEIAAAILRSQQFEHAAEVELEWLTDAEKKLASLGDIRLEQDQTVAQLQVQKAFSMDILRHKDAIDEIVKTGEAIISSSDEEEKQSLQDKVQTLLEKYDAVSHINAERYLQLERAQSLASQFWETYDELWPWLLETRSVVSQLPAPAIEYETLKQQEEELRQMRELIAEHKPHIDKMNKTGPQLLELSPVEGLSIQEKYTVTDKLFMQIKEDVKQRAVALDEAISKSTQFHDKIDPMMETLGRIAERLRQPPSISVEVEKIREQISENKNVSVDLEKLQPGYETLKQRGEEMIARSEGADKDISAKAVQDKLDHMVFIWEDIQALLEEREAKLLDVMDLAEKFWFDHCALIVTIKDTQDLLRDLEEPGTDPSVVKQQQESVESFKEEIDGLQEELDVVQNLADELMAVCGEPDKPVIKKSIDELNSACDNLNKNWKERVEILEEAMQSAVQFQDGLQGLFDWVDIVESKLDSMSPVGTDLETVKQQIGELKEFKLEAYQLQIEMERLNQQAEMLLKKVVDENDRHPITEPLTELRMLWDSLDQKIINRQHKLEGALLALGQFQHALDELLTWLTHTEDSLKEQKKTGGDPKAIEIELAKHHVLQNDVLAHKTTVEAVEKAGNDMIESSAGEEASSLQSKLENLNQRWKTVLEKTGQRQQHLESALLQAQGFHGEIEDMQKWLKDTERQLLASKAVGGLPETAREQLNIHLELLNVFEAKEEQYISLMQKGQQLITICPEGHDANTEQDLKNLKEKWESVQTKTTERKVKLEEALTLATQFHNSLQDFINWLTQAEQTLTMATPASLILDDILFQIDEHKVFVTEVNCHREQIIELDKTGTHLKYFSQKQDVVLIKNLLISVQSRWEKVVQRSVERGRALDDARKRAKQFHEAWNKLMEWLEESEKALDSEQEIANDPDKIKMQLAQHKDFQKALGGKHSVFDTSIRTGRSLKEKTSLKDDNQKLDDMLSELRDKWDTVCGKSVERQNKLEEALLFSGHFTDALQALIDWLYKVEPQLAEDQPVHGDIDLVLNLIDNHKVFQKELGKRTSSVQALKHSARELTEISHDDSSWVKVQMQELSTRWETVCALSVSKQTRLEQALCQAEEFHSTVHILLEWLAEAEQSLRFHGALPDDEEALCALLDLHKEFMRKLEEKRVGLSKATGLGEVILTICHPDSITTIKHWNTIIKARFEEVLAWAKQHQHRLGSALKELLANRELLETLLGWLQWAETTLNEKDKETIPQQIEEVKTLIAEHQTFMEEMTRKQPNVDKLTKTYKRRGAAEPPPIQSNIPVLDKGRGRRKRSPMQRMYPSSTNTQIETKNPRVNLLVSKWQQVWLLALDRRRKLNDALDRLEEEFANFDFDIWRKRYMRWMNHKKSRVMDFFRRIDKDQDGKITRQEFIDGILSSKFPTSRLEMSAVADIFDRDGDGYIDYYEFVAALHPNKDAYKPLTDADKIEDEVTRQVAKCKCPKRFQVEQIGANKYRFGDSQQLRLVRILRSTVMVRVGGGWMALDEFLVKNDPCRAKGRTNMELREKFILPEGVTQIIGSFRYRGHKSRPSSRAASPNRSNSSHCCVSVPPTPNLTTTSTPKGTPIQGSKLRLPGYLSGKGFHAGEESSLITAAASKARTQSAETKKTPSRPGSRAGSKAGSRASSRRGSDASDFDISEILSVCSDMSETVPDSNKTGPRAGHRPSSAKPSKIPTPQRRSPAASKLAKASKR